jgi:hypothetical protein
VIDLSRACDSFLDSSWPFPRVTEVGVREARQQSSRWSIRPSLMACYPQCIHCEFIPWTPSFVVVRQRVYNNLTCYNTRL